MSDLTSALPSTDDDSLPVFAHEVISLYAEAMADVRFPDLDLDVLQSSAAELRAAQACVERAAAALEVARAAAEERAELLHARAERALAYARVFADGNAELSERVAAIARGSAAPRAQSTPVKKRGRPRKSAGDASLFDSEPASEPSLEAVDSAA